MRQSFRGAAGMLTVSSIKWATINKHFFFSLLTGAFCFGILPKDYMNVSLPRYAALKLSIKQIAG